MKKFFGETQVFLGFLHLLFSWFLSQVFDYFYFYFSKNLTNTKQKKDNAKMFEEKVTFIFLLFLNSKMF